MVIDTFISKNENCNDAYIIVCKECDKSLIITMKDTIIVDNYSQSKCED